MHKYIFLLMVFLLADLDSKAQTIEGFWGVNEVVVGVMDVTPVAKWFIYEQDHTYQSGNGWAQNDIGTWTFNDETMEFLPESNIGGPDDYGAFKVKFVEDKMFWEREEDGMPVVVSLSRIDEMPMSPADSIAGEWDLISIKNGASDLTSIRDPAGLQSILIRRGQTYKMTNPDGAESFGYWHMDAHSPEFHLIDFDRTVDFQIFTVSFRDNFLLMRPKNENDLVLTYKRK